MRRVSQTQSGNYNGYQRNLAGILTVYISRGPWLILQIEKLVRSITYYTIVISCFSFLGIGPRSMGVSFLSLDAKSSN